jgi:peptide/nickel transport system permease protein
MQERSHGIVKKHLRGGYTASPAMGKKSVVAGILILLVITCVAIFAPFIVPNDPLAVDMQSRFKKPCPQFPLGTDNLGRCVASRLLWGARLSLAYGLSVLGIVLLVSIPLGLFAGYMGGLADLIIMRIVDMGLSIPSFLMALAVAGTLGPDIHNMIIAMGLVWWTPYTRLIRGLTLQIKEQEFILAAKAAACTHRQIVIRHILRNSAPTIIVMATLELGSIILAISSYSFIGLGAQPPTPEWGIMLSDSREFMQTHPELMIYPGIAIMLTVAGFNFLGEGLKNAMFK